MYLWTVYWCMVYIPFGVTITFLITKPIPFPSHKTHSFFAFYSTAPFHEQRFWHCRGLVAGTVSRDFSEHKIRDQCSWWTHNQDQCEIQFISSRDPPTSRIHFRWVSLFALFNPRIFLPLVTNSIVSNFNFRCITVLDVLEYGVFLLFYLVFMFKFLGL
jgi:hypothetical protein